MTRLKRGRIDGALKEGLRAKNAFESYGAHIIILLSLEIAMKLRSEIWV
jgi:hypothetical protein